MRAKPVPPLDEYRKARFWALVRKGAPDECWPWIGGIVGRKGKCQYGGFKVAKRRIGSNRVALSIHLGRSLTADEWALHTCDNPRCCNPAHLYIGTHQDNMADRKTRGRVASGERHCRAKLTWANVREIRGLARKVHQRTLAARFGVRETTVANIWAGRTWRETGGPDADPS